MSWIYRVETAAVGDPSALRDHLNRDAEDRWELVTVTYVSDAPPDQRFVMIFKQVRL